LTPHLRLQHEGTQEQTPASRLPTSHRGYCSRRGPPTAEFAVSGRQHHERVKPTCRWASRSGNCWRNSRRRAPTRIYITYGGHARQLKNVDPGDAFGFARLIWKACVKDVNNVNVRSVAAEHRHHVEEKKSDEPVTFNDGCMCRFSANEKKLISAGGTFSAPKQSRHRAAVSTPVKFPSAAPLLLLNNKDRPGIVGHLGTLLGKHKINIANMSLTRDTPPAAALTALNLDSARRRRQCSPNSERP